MSDILKNNTIFVPQDGFCGALPANLMPKTFFSTISFVGLCEAYGFTENPLKKTMKEEVSQLLNYLVMIWYHLVKSSNL